MREPEEYAHSSGQDGRYSGARCARCYARGSGMRWTHRPLYSVDAGVTCENRTWMRGKTDHARSTTSVAAVPLIVPWCDSYHLGILSLLSSQSNLTQSFILFSPRNTRAALAFSRLHACTAPLSLLHSLRWAALVWMKRARVPPSARQ